MELAFKHVYSTHTLAFTLFALTCPWHFVCTSLASSNVMQGSVCDRMLDRLPNLQNRFSSSFAAHYGCPLVSLNVHPCSFVGPENSTTVTLLSCLYINCYLSIAGEGATFTWRAHRICSSFVSIYCSHRAKNEKGHMMLLLLLWIAWLNSPSFAFLWCKVVSMCKCVCALSACTSLFISLTKTLLFTFVN